jgi:MerR family mercuric resistance operon transcriptional regulator
MTTMAEKERLMTIGRVAQATGVTTHTLRYYQKEGTLAPKVRNGAGYRLYDAEALERLQFVRSAQAVGFTLNDIRTLLSLNSSNVESCQIEVQGLLEQRLAEVDEKLRDLKRVRGALGHALDRCHSSGGECAVLSDLDRGKKKRRR